MTIKLIIVPLTFVEYCAEIKLIIWGPNTSYVAVQNSKATLHTISEISYVAYALNLIIKYSFAFPFALFP